MLSILLFLKFLFFPFPQHGNEASRPIPKTIYSFNVEALTGGRIEFSKFMGKKILIVNTASECGNTPQYADLQKLADKYKDKLVIVGFPANNFGAQEPGSNKQIAEFCSKNYAVTFPMAAKVSVKGDDMAPIYHWLTEKKYNNFKDSKVKWNFQKYLLDEKGKLVAVFEPGLNPSSKEVTDAIEGVVAAK